jgi:hypothetical protein
MEDRRMLVFYIGVANMDNRQIEEYVKDVQNRFFTEEFVKRNNCEIFLIPTRETNSKIECINPVYITDEKLIAEHEALLSELNDSIYKFNNERKSN